MMRHIACSTILFLAFCASPSIAATCYEDVEVPAAFTCNGNSSRSADFSNGCTYEAAKTVKKEVACPATWVSVSSSDTVPTRAEVCERKNMSPSNVDGFTCASGEQRPKSGVGAASIIYRYGTSGGGDGGSVITNHTTSGSTGGCSPNSSGSCEDFSYTYRYCYADGQKKDWENSDRVVAYACK